MMTIKITSSMLCDLCGGHFTYDACEALCNYFEDFELCDAPTIGDICISFSEIPADWTDEYDEDTLIATLDNGNVLISL